MALSSDLTETLCILNNMFHGIYDYLFKEVARIQQRYS